MARMKALHCGYRVQLQIFQAISCGRTAFKVEKHEKNRVDVRFLQSVIMGWNPRWKRARKEIETSWSELEQMGNNSLKRVFNVSGHCMQKFSSINTYIRLMMKPARGVPRQLSNASSRDPLSFFVDEHKSGEKSPLVRTLQAVICFLSSATRYP